MTDFEKALYKHVKLYSGGVVPQFIYEDGTTISPKILEELISQYKQFEILQEMWDKEKDYCRLLRKENNELQDELDYVYNSMNEDSLKNANATKKDEENYLS